MREQLKKTSLYERHLRLGAKMMPFGGFSMPIQYTSITEEHLATRKKAGLFDLSHMGEFVLMSTGASEFLSRITTGDPEKMPEGTTLYTLFCNPQGGVVDDLIVYRLEKERFMLVVNAANIQKDFKWVEENLGRDGVRFENISDTIALIALQGPMAETIFRDSPYHDGANLKRNQFLEFETEDAKVLVSRTGYTGEDGFELYTSSRFAPKVWDALMEKGKRFGLLPVGLGARDTLRLEARLPLYGHELDEDITPFEAGIGWTVALDKEDFIGKKALLQQKERGVRRVLAGFEMLEQGIPRQGCAIWKEKIIGAVTSGTFSPFFKKNIGLGYVPTEEAKPGTEIFIEIRDRKLKAKIVETPFYRMKPRLTE